MHLLMLDKKNEVTNMNEIIDELYELYRQKVEEASDMFKSEWYPFDDEKRDKEDKEELEYFNSLLRKLR